MKENCSIVRIVRFFDWRKVALCLMSVASLCAFTGSASGLPGFSDLPPGFPGPLNPFNPLPPVEPEDFADRLKPILRFLGSFIAGDSGPKFEEYDARVRDDDEDYEAHICRGFVRLTSLSESASVSTFVEKFGFKVDEDSGAIGFSSPKSWFDFGEELRDNVGVDKVCEIALPVLEAALADYDTGVRCLDRQTMLIIYKFSDV